MRLCSAPTLPSSIVCQSWHTVGSSPVSPNLVPKWPREQKSHLGGRPRMDQKGLRRFTWARHIVLQPYLHLGVLHCWNPGVGSYVNFSISFLTICFSPFLLLLLILFLQNITSNGLQVFCVQWAKSMLSIVVLYLLFCQCSLIFYILPVNFVWFYLLRISGWDLLLSISLKQKNLDLALVWVTRVYQPYNSILWTSFTRLHHFKGFFPWRTMNFNGSHWMTPESSGSGNMIVKDTCQHTVLNKNMKPS